MNLSSFLDLCNGQFRNGVTRHDDGQFLLVTKEKTQEAFSHGNIAATDNTFLLWLFGYTDCQVVSHIRHLFPRVSFLFTLYLLALGEGHIGQLSKKFQKNNARWRNKSLTGITITYSITVSLHNQEKSNHYGF